MEFQESYRYLIDGFVIDYARKLTPKDFILKAIDSPIHIIFLIHTGVLDDEAREKFINQCNLAKKMYCIVDAEDLARLLIAYGKM